MKIRTGFVTNSSSTNFLILSKHELNVEKLFSLLGFTNESPLAEVGLELCNEILGSTKKHAFYHGDYLRKLSKEDVEKEYDKQAADKFEELVNMGWLQYWGSIEALDGITGFFATDSFIYEDKDIYIDGRDCIW